MNVIVVNGWLDKTGSCHFKKKICISDQIGFFLGAGHKSRRGLKYTKESPRTADGATESTLGAFVARSQKVTIHVSSRFSNTNLRTCISYL